MPALSRERRDISLVWNCMAGRERVEWFTTTNYCVQVCPVSPKTPLGKTSSAPTWQYIERGSKRETMRRRDIVRERDIWRELRRLIGHLELRETSMFYFGARESHTVWVLYSRNILRSSAPSMSWKFGYWYSGANLSAASMRDSLTRRR